MHLAEIWRYPVKSMAGERLDAVELGRDGVPGDRLVQVRERNDPNTGGERIVTALRSKLAGSEADVEAAFADPDRPARAGAAELIVRGKLDLETWREVARAA